MNMDEEDKQSDCDSDELGYNVIDTDEKMGENSFSYVQDSSNRKQYKAIEGRPKAMKTLSKYKS